MLIIPEKAIISTTTTAKKINTEPKADPKSIWELIDDAVPVAIC